jgi:hypothetical protein
MSGDRKPFPLAQTAFAENSAAFSPDGRWIAYIGDEAGEPSVYVQAFPSPATDIRYQGRRGDRSGDRTAGVFSDRPDPDGPRISSTPNSPKLRRLFLGAAHSTTARVQPGVRGAKDGQRFLVIAKSRQAGSANHRPRQLDGCGGK